MMRKLLVFMLCLSIISLLFTAGCSSKTEESGQTSQAGEQTAQGTVKEGSSEQGSKGYSLPLTTKGEVIKIITPQTFSTKMDLSKILPIFKKTEEETGIKLDWQVITPDYNTTMQTMLASGDVDADLISVPGNPGKYISSGLFMPLDDLIENYAPNMKKAFEIRPDIKKLCEYDEKMYVLPNRFAVDEQGRKAPSLWVTANMVRKDVLEKMGLGVPETIDELYNFLKAWKKENPNKYPWAMRSGFDVDYSNGSIMSLASSYGIYLGNGDANAFYPENGKIVYQYTKPEMKVYLEVMKKWWDEGLINPSCTGNKDFEKAVAEATSGNCVFFQGWATEIPAYGWHTTQDGGTWVPMKVPEGPNGDRIIIKSAAGIMTGYSAVMANSKNAELLIKWLDHALYSEIGLIRGYFGLEGETYDMVDGKPKLKDELVNQPDWTSKLFDMGTQMYVLPIPYSVELSNMYDIITYEKNNLGYQVDYVKTMKDGAVDPYYSMIPTPEEESLWNRYYNEVNTYKDEMIAKFVMGSEPLDKFDEFVEKLNALGLDKLLEIEQAKYNRFAK